jgi:branched-subunit amino acid ABC-type transport system permease component
VPIAVDALSGLLTQQGHSEACPILRKIFSILRSTFDQGPIFLLVVAVGGSGSLWGPLAGALVLGLSDTAGKYLFADAGSFCIYAVAVLILLVKPAGLYGHE